MATTTRLKFDPVRVEAIMHGFDTMEVVAIAINMQHKISFRDALIAAAAESATCETLLSEDLKDGASMG